MVIVLPIKKTKQFVCTNSDCADEFYEDLLIEYLEHVSSDHREMGTENQYEFETDIVSGTQSLTQLGRYSDNDE